MYAVSYPIVWPALNAASPEFIVPADKKLKWRPVNMTQVALIQAREESELMMSTLGEDELAAFAAPTAEEVNSFMSDRKVDLRLEPWTEPDTIGMAAVIKVLRRKWYANVASGYEFDDGRAGYALRSDGKTPIFMGHTQGTMVMTVGIEGGWEMTFVDQQKPMAVGDFDLLDVIMACREMAQPTSKYGGLLLPSLLAPDIRPNMDNLLEMHTKDASGKKWKIVQAMEQIRFAMGPYGISAMAGFAAAAMFESCMMAHTPEKDLFQLNQGALWSLHRDGFELPVIAGVFEQEDTSAEDVDVNELDW